MNNKPRLPSALTIFLYVALSPPSILFGALNVILLLSFLVFGGKTLAIISFSSIALYVTVILFVFLFDSSQIDKILEEQLRERRRKREIELDQLEIYFSQTRGLKSNFSLVKDLRNIYDDFLLLKKQGIFKESYPTLVANTIERVFEESTSNLKTIWNLHESGLKISTKSLSSQYHEKRKQLEKEVEKSVEGLGNVIVNLKVEDDILSSKTNLTSLLKELEKHLEIADQIKMATSNDPFMGYSPEQIAEYENSAEKSERTLENA